VASKLEQVQNANFPMDSEGRVYHLAVKRGEVANRILIVDEVDRATILSKKLDNPDNLLVISNRGFITYSGTYNKIPLSIILATNTGTALVDFIVRECCAVIDGPMIVLRLGSGTSIRPDVNIGSVVATESSVLIRRNPDHWFTSTQNPSPNNAAGYTLSQPVVPDTKLTDMLFSKMVPDVSKVPNEPNHPKIGNVKKGITVTADVFASLGQEDPNFNDDNSNLLDTLAARYPGVCSIDMETFQLLHLAVCNKAQTIHASTAVLIIAQHKSAEFLDTTSKNFLESHAGRACLDTLTEYDP